MKFGNVYVHKGRGGGVGLEDRIAITRMGGVSASLRSTEKRGNRACS